MDYQLIKKLCQEKGVTLENLAESVGMSRTGMNTSFKNNSLKIETLEKIAEKLGVTICYFFNEQEGANENIEEIRRRIKDSTITIEFWYYIQDKLQKSHKDFFEPYLTVVNRVLSSDDKKKIIEDWLKWNKEHEKEISEMIEVEDYNTISWEQLNQYYNTNLMDELYKDHKIELENAILEGSAVFIHNLIEDSLVRILFEEEFISGHQFIDNTATLIIDHFKVLPESIKSIYKKYFSHSEVERYFKFFFKELKPFPKISQLGQK